jgi:plastocyanin
MEKTTRRSLLRNVAAGGAAAAGLGFVAHSRSLGAISPESKPRNGHEHGHQPGAPLQGKHAGATVNFGAWATAPIPLDRFPASSPNNRNVHLLLPREVDIEVGGSVSFIISGVHLVLVYGDGTEKEHINSTLLTPDSTPPGLIDDPNNRVYRGLDPRPLDRDRVEVVHFANPGRYFVTCGLLPHFNEGMNGYVNVKHRED